MKIYIIAGEPSGDILASRLMIAIRKKYPEAEFFGTGGETMAAEGFKSLFNIKDLSVMGVMEVIPKLPVILRHRREVMTDIEKVQPDVIVTVDSWGFVNSILKNLKKKGIKTPKVHYVAPQVWAWKKGRAKKAAQLMDHLMTLLPYEPPYFEKHGLACTFVGHPVIENTANLPTDIAALKKQNNIPEDARVLCVLPGSRNTEIKKLAPVFVKSVQLLHREIPELYLLIPSVEAIKSEINSYFKDINVPYKLVTGQQARYEAFCMSEFAIAASGTVSLELTACGTPHLIAYKFNWLTNKIADIFVKVKYANLINILADKFIIPEFTLNKCRADLIAVEALEFSFDEDKRNAQMAEAKIYLQQLRPADKLPSEKAAEVVLQAIVK
jgi:lipid-A-disaccharide synthase